MVALLLSACVDTASPEQDPAEPGPAQVDGGVPLDGPCERDEDCAPGLHCDGDHPLATGTGCERVWRCAAEDVCSALSPSWVCGCDGEVFSAAAMCAGRKFAGPVVATGPMEDLTGEPCDPDNLEDFRFDLSLSGRGFAPFASGSVLVRAIDPVSGRSANRFGVYLEEDGTFSARWLDFVHPGVDEVQIDVLGDADGDGVCGSEGDRGWIVSATPVAESPGDLHATVDGRDPGDDAACLRWSE